MTALPSALLHEPVNYEILFYFTIKISLDKIHQIYILNGQPDIIHTSRWLTGYKLARWKGNFFDLSGLKTVEWEIGVSTEKNARYQIKVVLSIVCVCVMDDF